jgi:hypothetical protein
MTVLAWLCLASLTGSAREPLFTQSVVNRWDIVVFQVRPDFTLTLGWPLPAKEAPEWRVPELRAASDLTVPLEWPKKNTADTDNYAALNDWGVNIERSDRVPGSKRERPGHSSGKMKFTPLGPVGPQVL